jgi:Ser/Thr protein kinase RdoA (MazF antagonist)
MGDSVLRTAGPWTDSVQALLRHLRALGVDWVPEPLGRAEDGREAVAFLEGEVPAYPMPGWVWDDAVLVDAARRLRELHEATRDFDLAGRCWRLPAHEPVEVVCHNDFAPYNFVFRDGALAGVIDWDTASPGPRVWDAAYLAYRLVPLTSPGNPDAIASSDSERRRRLELLCATYGGLDPDEVVSAVPGRLDELMRLGRHVEIYSADAAHIRSNSAGSSGSSQQAATSSPRKR